MTIGQTIAKQLGNAALALMGARSLVAFENGLQFGIGANAKKVTKIRIELDPSDTYTVRFYTGKPETTKFNPKTGEFVTRGGLVEVATVEGVYVDCLHRTIEGATGLYLSF